jgi:hypothetical protein
MAETYVIAGYQRGRCALCEKDERDTLHLRCPQGSVDGFVCLKCTVQLLKLRTSASHPATPVTN